MERGKKASRRQRQTCRSAGRPDAVDLTGERRSFLVTVEKFHAISGTAIFAMTVTIWGITSGSHYEVIHFWQALNTGTLFFPSDAPSLVVDESSFFFAVTTVSYLLRAALIFKQKDNRRGMYVIALVSVSFLPRIMWDKREKRDDCERTGPSDFQYVGSACRVFVYWNTRNSVWFSLLLCKRKLPVQNNLSAFL